LNYFLIRIMVFTYQSSDGVLLYGPGKTTSDMGYWLETIIITGDTSCYYYIIKLSGFPLVYNICATVLSHLTCLFSDFHTAFLFLL